LDDLAYFVGVVFGLPLVAAFGIELGVTVLEAILDLLLFPWRSRQ